MKVYILTNDVQLARKRMHEEICREWQQSARDAVRNGIPCSRILTVIGQRHGMSMQNVDKILRRAGIYQGAKKFRQSVIEEGEQNQQS